MTKLTQKERRERKKSKQTPNKNECYSDTDDENDNNTHHEYHEQQQDYFKSNKIFNISENDLTPNDFQMIKQYFEAKKRTITFNGEAPHEVMNMTDDILYFYGFTGCFVSILASNITCQDIQCEYLFQWVKEKDKVMVLKLNENDDVVSFAILHETNYDPFKRHKRPFVMDYIFTYEKYRNMGHAQALIKSIKSKYEFTAFCNTNLSAIVFNKCGLDIIQNKNNKHVVIARTKSK